MNINECREIYREAFGSDGEFENRLFTCCFKYCSCTEWLCRFN